MKKKRITLKQLANILGVSVSTASKALNDSYEISEGTKEKVRQAALKYNYYPNLLAQGLKTNRTNTLGVVIPDMRAPFFFRVLRGIEKRATELGYNILTCFSNESYNKERSILEMLSQGKVDAIIMSLSEETQKLQKTDHIDQLIYNGVPVTLFDRVDDHFDCDKIVVDDFDASYRATRKLILSGARNIVLLSSIGATSTGKERYKGYAKALSEKENIEELVLAIEHHKEIDDKLNHLLDEHPVDAILATNELTGVTALNSVTQRGLKVPQDISIIGFTNGLLAMNSNPPLTTISQHGKEMGRIVTEKTVERLKNEKKGHSTTVIKTTLIQRGSTK